MGKRLAVIIVVGLVVIAAVLWLTGFSLPQGIQVSYYRLAYAINGPEGDSPALQQLHRASPVSVEGSAGKELTYEYGEKDKGLVLRESARCIACHGSMVDEGKKAEEARFYVHQKMLNTTLLNFSCTDCHKTVDLSERSPEKPTFRVDRAVCPACHNPQPEVLPATANGGSSWGVPGSTFSGSLMELHGYETESAKDWIYNHPRVAVAIGVDRCRECHIYDTELDFCRTCHVRGGMRPSSHRLVYKVPLNKLYPGNTKTNVVETKWKGYHFVFVREALAQLGVKADSPQNLPFDQLHKLTCAACHDLKDWCTRCHIKHANNWLNPAEGHPQYVSQYGTQYCFNCHDALASKCLSCHEFVGRLD